MALQQAFASEQTRSRLNQAARGQRAALAARLFIDGLLDGDKEEVAPPEVDSSQIQSFVLQIYLGWVMVRSVGCLLGHFAMKTAASIILVVWLLFRLFSIELLDGRLLLLQQLAPAHR